MEEILNQEAANEIEIENSLFAERNALKAEKREIKGRLYDLQFEDLDPDALKQAKEQVAKDYEVKENNYYAHVAEVKKDLLDKKKAIAELKSFYHQKIEDIRKNEHALPLDEVNQARILAKEQLTNAKNDYLAQLNAYKNSISQIKTEAKRKDKVLRAQYHKLKKAAMKRSDKEDALDNLKGQIYSNTGTAELDILDLKNKIVKLKKNYAQQVKVIENDLHLKTNHVGTLIKNTKAEEKEKIRALKEQENILNENYSPVAPLQYQIGRKFVQFGNNFVHNQKVAFTTKAGLSNWFIKSAVYLIILLMVIITAAVKPAWFSFDTLITIVKHTSSLLPLALGVAGTIVLTGTDLSLGRIWGLTALISGILLGYGSTNGVILEWTQNMPWIWIIVVLIIVMGVGGFAGGINGFFVAKFSIHPFIVTLATQLIIYGVILLLGSSLNNLSVIYKMNNATAQSYYNFVSSGFYLGDVLVEWYNIMAIVLLVAMWFIWNKTKFGKAMFAVGCNPEAANVSGINVSRTILLTFVLAGACYGVGGFQYNPINGGAQLSTGTGGELDPITAAVIGGVSFTGGIGKVSGVLLGSLLLKVIDSCLLALGVSTAYINIVKGSIILVAVALDMKKYIVKK